MEDYKSINITSSTIETVQSTAHLLEENAISIVEIMYAHLFTNYPQFKNMFDMKKQADGDKKQIVALTKILIKFAKDFPNTDRLMQGLNKANRIHVSLTIQPSDYEYIAESLLYAIQTEFSLQGNDTILKEWRKAYWLLANAMISVEKQMMIGEKMNVAM